tara:strand:- start:928 stop:1131 length:204 start_codon:yes stop_codon:yes gene_type:complete
VLQAAAAARGTLTHAEGAAFLAVHPAVSTPDILRNQVTQADQDALYTKSVPALFLSLLTLKRMTSTH